MYRILLVEDRVALRQVLVSVIGQQHDMTVVAEAGSLAELHSLELAASSIDIAIVNLALSDKHGLHIVTQLHRADPNLMILVFDDRLDPSRLAAAVEVGVCGVLHRSNSLEEIVDRLRRAGSGEWLLSSRELVNLLAGAAQERERQRDADRIIRQLTPREREVLQAMADGLDAKEIARSLSISVETERTHVVHILTKLGLHTRLQALVFALRHEVVHLK